MTLSPATGFLEHVAASVFNKAIDLRHNATTSVTVERINKRTPNTSTSARRYFSGESVGTKRSSCVRPHRSRRSSPVRCLSGGHEPMRYHHRSLAPANVGALLRDVRFALPPLLVAALTLGPRCETYSVVLQRLAGEGSASASTSIHGTDNSYCQAYASLPVRLQMLATRRTASMLDRTMRSASCTFAPHSAFCRGKERADTRLSPTRTESSSAPALKA